MKLLNTLKDTFISSLPLLLIIIVCLLIAPLENINDYGKLTIGYASVIIGQSLFLVGLESSILPIGHLIGGAFAKYKKTIVIILFGFVFGLLATVAEPAISVLSKQANLILPAINMTLFIWVTSTGIGICVALALYRILKDINIKYMFGGLYILVFIIVLFAPKEFVALAFDASGATTGDVSVPFILALGMGISITFSKNKTNDDSFGIIGIASVGPIIFVLLYGIILKIANNGSLPPANDYDLSSNSTLLATIVVNLKDVLLAILPIILISIPFQIFMLKIPKKEFLKMIIGVIPVYLGLLIFLSGIDYGFGFAGQHIGQAFFDQNRPNGFYWLLLIVGFVLGASITLSEPAVTVLANQIEELTNGHIKNKTIKITLAIGIGFASLLSILKIITQINILYFLIPLYLLSLVMMIFTPKMFVGLAFDSGGVTGGALTSAFLTPLTLGIAQMVCKNMAGDESILTNGFGIIAFISVTPLIAIQLLGIVYDRANKSSKALGLLIKSELEEFLQNAHTREDL